MIKTISLGTIPCCDEFGSIAPHGLKNFDDVIILNLDVRGVIYPKNGDFNITFTTLTSDNFKVVVDDKFVKLMVSNNDTFFEVVYVTITYTRISMTNSFYGLWPTMKANALKTIINSAYGKSIYELSSNANLGIKKVIFNKPATVVLWEDGSKTVVKVNKGERWDPEKGLAMAIIKKKYGLKQFLKYMEEFK